MARSLSFPSPALADDLRVDDGGGDRCVAGARATQPRIDSRLPAGDDAGQSRKGGSRS